MSERNSSKEPYEQRRRVMEEVIRAMNRVNPKGYYTVLSENNQAAYISTPERTMVGK